VNKFNHELKDDGIVHVHITKFEDICEPDSLEALIQRHGPFDIVLGAAPCQDYSAVNARRKGTTGGTGQYLLKVGEMIHFIEKYQKRRNPLIYFSENVVLEKKEIEEVNERYRGIPPVQVDAQDFSPCRRNRLYWLNIPISSIAEASQVSQESLPILEDGGIMPEEIGQAFPMAIKANTFMASKGRINDSRMMKVEQVRDSDRFVIKTFSVREREIMLGLPVGYVSEPVNTLFKELTRDAFVIPEQTDPNTDPEGRKHWSDFLDPTLWHFQEKCRFRFKMCGGPPFAKLEMTTPQENSAQLVYFDAISYSKHLLGNGWSIPVVEFLLEKVKDVCQTTQSYQRYSYHFPWQPYSSMGNADENVDGTVEV